MLARKARLGADFNDEDSVKSVIATQQQWSVSIKVNAVDALESKKYNKFGESALETVPPWTD